ncbi:hypothetical protein [Cytobacillus sp.]|uniref:hypothetical protein n=1 Tax=Cytobacillus sp. TaxID=2675269 RepID=UPI0028BD3984|nr:hypothetical protein [Cytobacillus sp.]
MKKKIIIGVVIAFATIAGCSNQETKVVKENENFSTHEDYKSWVTNKSFSIQTEDGVMQFIGEDDSFLLISEVFRVEIENTYTWLIWVNDKENRNKMIGGKVQINGISEKEKGNEIFLAEGEIQAVSQGELQVPDSDKVVKLVANMKPLREGKWKLKPYLHEKLLGTTVVTVLGK